MKIIYHNYMETYTSAPQFPIHVNLDDPRCPPDVIHSIVADMIRMTIQDDKLDIDPLLNKFLDIYPSGAGYEWQKSVVDQLYDKPLDIIKPWVYGGLPKGLFRSQLKLHLEEREKELECQHQTQTQNPL